MKTHLKKHKIIIVPSSEQEGKYENATSYKDAEKIYEQTTNIDLEGTDRFSFDTTLERDAFLQGYHHAIGYLGNGLYFANRL